MENNRQQLRDSLNYSVNTRIVLVLIILRVKGLRAMGTGSVQWRTPVNLRVCYDPEHARNYTGRYYCTVVSSSDAQAIRCLNKRTRFRFPISSVRTVSL